MGKDDNFGVEPMADHAKQADARQRVLDVASAYPEYGYRKVHAAVNMDKGAPVSARQVRKHLEVGKENYSWLRKVRGY